MDKNIIAARILAIASELPTLEPWRIERRLESHVLEEKALGLYLQGKAGSVGYDMLYGIDPHEVPRVLIHYMLRCLDTKLQESGGDSATSCFVHYCTWTPDVPLGEFLAKFGKCPLEELLLLAECLHVLVENPFSNNPDVRSCLNSFWHVFPRQRV